jgi:hypothetical protein
MEWIKIKPGCKMPNHIDEYLVYFNTGAWGRGIYFSDIDSWIALNKKFPFDMSHIEGCQWDMYVTHYAEFKKPED